MTTAAGYHSTKWLAAALAAAFALRLALIVYAEAGGPFAFGDGRFYVELGRSLAAGRGLAVSEDIFAFDAGRGAWAQARMARWRRTGMWDFVVPGRPTAFVMPLYPTFVGVVFFVWGPRVLAARLVQLLLSLAVPLLLYDVGRRAFGRRAGVIAAWGGALYPFFIFFAASLTNQLFSIIAVLAVADGYYWLRGHRGRLAAVGFGALAGAAFLTRAEILVPGAAAAGALFVADVRGRRISFAASRLLLIVAAAVAVALPWAVRNKVSLGHFSFFATQAPRVLWEANVQPLSREFGRGDVPAYQALYQKLRAEELGRLARPELAEMPVFAAGVGEFERAALLRARVLSFLAANPRVYGRLCALRARQLFRWTPLNFAGAAYRLAYAAYPLLLASALVGLALSFRRPRPYYLYFLTVYAAAVLILIIYGTSYRVGALEPWLVVFGAFAWARAGELWRRRRPSIRDGKGN